MPSREDRNRNLKKSQVTHNLVGERGMKNNRYLKNACKYEKVLGKHRESWSLLSEMNKGYSGLLTLVKIYFRNNVFFHKR